MFDELLRLPFELPVSHSFGFVERQAALGRMNLTLRRMPSAEDEAVCRPGELANATQQVAAGHAGFGEDHTTIGGPGSGHADVNARVADDQAGSAHAGLTRVNKEVGS